MERLWAQRGDEIMEHLAAEKPEVLAGLVARLIPQSLMPLRLSRARSRIVNQINRLP